MQRYDDLQQDEDELEFGEIRRRRVRLAVG
jgi:hypothetical protein